MLALFATATLVSLMQSNTPHGWVPCDDPITTACVRTDDAGNWVRFDEGANEITMTVLDASSGEARQNFSTERWQNRFQPEFRDINQDGLAELVVPTDAGAANLTWSIWQWTEERYALAGNVSGLGLEYDAETDLIAATARFGQASAIQQTYRLQPSGLVPVYDLVSELSDGSCELTPGAGFADSGLDAEALVTQCETELKAP
ncbi:MAG: hypothetical protein NXI03_02450 [Alphaproteobacteria bacterium]|uniref:hypothetical protein n=1 Tax=Maricaulis alexandrii TaxID=2570354 RepID=UPI001108F7C8|nr:hypothetical protein [Maricaulis alexandrii]MCR9266406.1 hypothetical protein [Alphaproteobacteria bacterium]